MVARVAIMARPGSRSEALAWDPWRDCWVVHVTEPPTHGEANRALQRALARWLDVAERDVSWARGERTARKVAEISGLSDDEVRERLARAARNSEAP